MLKSLIKSSRRMFSQQKKLTSVPNHKAPSSEESIHGRYAEVLFTVASKNEKISVVQEDMQMIKKHIEKSDNFKSFLSSQMFNTRDQQKVLEPLIKQTD